MHNNNFPFKEGDWIVPNHEVGHVELIKFIQDDMCIFEDGHRESKYDVQKNYHFWTIKDARDGDVLFLDLMCGKTFIYNGVNPEMTILYSFIINNDGEDVLPYDIGKPNTGIGDIEENKNIIHPATLEQRNILWQKMREKGYKWNSRTKEVVKAPFKLEGTLFSARDRGIIDEIIFALKTLGEEKMICYTEEIKFLEKIRKL